VAVDGDDSVHEINDLALSQEVRAVVQLFASVNVVPLDERQSL